MARVYVTEIRQSIDEHLQQILTYLEWDKLIRPKARVFIKPNLTYPSPKLGVTTPPDFIEAVIRALSHRTNELVLGESDGGYRGWPAEFSFATHNLPDICKRYGVKLVNLSKAATRRLNLVLSKGEITLDLPSILLDIDALVTLPVPKIHQITVISGAIKNQWGCIPDNMRILYHPYFEELILEINRLVSARMAIADGRYFLNRTGPMSGDPVKMGLIIASDNIGATDATICRIMGIPASDVPYLCKAQSLGAIPPENEITYNVSPDTYRKGHFYLHRDLRSRIVAYAFNKPWAVKLVWDSWIGDLLHKVLYAISGNPVEAEVHRIRAEHYNVR